MTPTTRPSTTSGWPAKRHHPFPPRPLLIAHGIPSASVKHIMSGGGGVGIAGMRERLEQLGGSLEIESGDSGTTVRAQLPLVEDAG